MASGWWLCPFEDLVVIGLVASADLFIVHRPPDIELHTESLLALLIQHLFGATGSFCRLQFNCTLNLCGKRRVAINRFDL